MGSHDPIHDWLDRKLSGNKSKPRWTGFGLPPPGSGKLSRLGTGGMNQGYIGGMGPNNMSPNHLNPGAGPIRNPAVAGLNRLPQLSPGAISPGMSLQSPAAISNMMARLGPRMLPNQRPRSPPNFNQGQWRAQTASRLPTPLNPRQTPLGSPPPPYSPHSKSRSRSPSGSTYGNQPTTPVPRIQSQYNPPHPNQPSNNSIPSGQPQAQGQSNRSPSRSSPRSGNSSHQPQERPSLAHSQTAPASLGVPTRTIIEGFASRTELERGSRGSRPG
ncbi:hypothetical protein HYFRA_00007738 [Hymenoscyphus fraxineus]|uniref:Uncharacterized protein n=1 Tax=Hymenoscyphus fraxineus TaxID=746836 RepID=A0A9N9PN94_9HELO|nr:hypothetical protein HYFRA_00007738 [Hymenoscyphus fraxineus]